MRGPMHHIDLTVKDPAASSALYGAFLGFLGYRHSREFEWRLDMPGGHTSVSLVPATGPGASQTHDRYSPGLHHIAWRAESRDDVNALHELLVKIDARVLDAPAEYPQYNKGNGYYAVFFADPDGLKVSVSRLARLTFSSRFFEVVGLCGCRGDFVFGICGGGERLVRQPLARSLGSSRGGAH
jgi:glyoxylase I family protein